MILPHQNQTTDGVITDFSSECSFLWTRTNQAIFSFRRAPLIQWVVNVPFFRFGGIPDWWGWRSLGEWSGHYPIFLMLARRAWTTLAAWAYLRECGS